MLDDNTEYVDATRAAKILGMSRQAFHRFWKRRLVGYQMSGRPNSRMRFKKTDVLALLEQTQKPSHQTELPGLS